MEVRSAASLSKNHRPQHNALILSETENLPAHAYEARTCQVTPFTHRVWTSQRSIRVKQMAGVIARLLAPVPNKPAGFLLTTGLGIAGAFVATFIGQAVGWYRPDQGAGFIAATVGAIVVLFVWNRVAASRRIPPA